MKALRIILIILIISVLVSGCATEGQVKNPVVSDIDGALNESLSSSTVFTGEEPVKPYYPYKNTGSAKELVGNNILISIFLEDAESTVNTQTETVILENTRKAADWLEAEAQKRGKTARIITGKEDSDLIIRYKCSGTVIDTNYDHYDTLLMLKDLKMGSLYSKITEKYGDANIVIILFLNKIARSFASPADPLATLENILMDDPYYADFGYFDTCVIFSRHYKYMDDIDFNPNLIAHELLHLYGAVDLYYECSENPQYGAMKAEQSIIAGTYLANEIMFNHDSTNEISDLTAYLIGWEETVPIKYVYLLYNP